MKRRFTENNMLEVIDERDEARRENVRLRVALERITLPATTRSEMVYLARQALALQEAR